MAKHILPSYWCSHVAAWRVKTRKRPLIVLCNATY